MVTYQWWWHHQRSLRQQSLNLPSLLRLVCLEWLDPLALVLVSSLEPWLDCLVVALHCLLLLLVPELQAVELEVQLEELQVLAVELQSDLLHPWLEQCQCLLVG